MSATSTASRFAIEIGTTVSCPNGKSGNVVDKWFQSEDNKYVCEVNYEDGETDIFYMSELSRLH